MAISSTNESVAEKIGVEQLLSTMLEELRFWLSERKPGKPASSQLSTCHHSQVESTKQEPKKVDEALN